MKNSVNIFFALKSCSASQHCMFHNFFTQSFAIFHVLFRPFFHEFFAHCHVFFHWFSRAFFRTSDFAHFSYHVFQRCAAKRLFIACSLRTAYNCPRDRSYPYLSIMPPFLTQHSHKTRIPKAAVWKNKIQISLCRQSAIF